ncbi:hemagglutinin repeat-containing protein [Volucribacter psittacicida]
MNKQCFRVIFSKTLQRLVVVSELAKSSDKSTSNKQSAVNFKPIFATLTSLSLHLFCALGFVSFSTPVLADTLIIKADPNAPRNQQPIVLQTANGLPQVNIQTPNNKGLSHNKYQDFNVDNKGAILNNSHKATQTQQAGFIQGNPYLAKGEAKVILNEVTSNNPSQLKGYLEVAGRKAEVIIANPNGLHCEGCGTINASRSTMTTGKPQIKEGQIDSFVVEKGKIKVSGKGLDNSRVDYTDILARETEINAGIWTNKKLNVVTGKNTIKQANLEKADDELQITRISAENINENNPVFALDVSELGGMYAGKIHLVGTEQGLGVRNAGHIGASADTLTIDSQGKIVNQAIINAQQQISLNAHQSIENQGRIENKTQDILLNANENINQTGSLIAQTGAINAQAQNISQSGESIAKGKINYKATDISTSQTSLLAAGVTTTQTTNGAIQQLETPSAQGADIVIQANNQAQLAGNNIASGELAVTAQSINLDNSKNQAYNIVVNAQTGNINANKSQLSAVENLKISTPKTLSTQYSQLSANHIQTAQQDLNTQNAVWQQHGTADFKLKLRYLQNQGGVFSTAGNFNINAKEIENTQGTIISAKNLSINTEILNNNEGLLNSQQALIQAEQINNQAGTILARDTYLNANLVNNQNTAQNGSLIIATNTLNITATQLNNQQTIATSTKPTQGLQGKNIQLNVAELNNQQGGIYATNTLATTVNQQLNNQSGELLAGQVVNIDSLDRHLVVDNQNGTIEAGQQLNLTAKTLQHEGTIKTQGDAEINLTDSFTLNQALQVGNNLTFTTQGNFTNNVKQVIGNQAIFNAINLLNTQYAEISSNRTIINATNITNYGLLDGSENIIKTQTLNNLGTGRVYGNHLAIQANNINNLKEGEKSATIAARERLDLAVGTLTNRDHSLILSLGDLAIGGQLNGQHQAEGYATFIDNGSATIEALGNGQIKAERLLNHDLYLTLGEHHSDERIIEYAPSTSSTRYATQNKDGGEGYFEPKNNDKHDSNSYFVLKNGQRIASRYWTNWNYNRHTVTSTIEHRDPAQILIGGNLSLSGADLENNASTLSIGKTLSLGDRLFTNNTNNENLTAGNTSLKNIDIEGTINITDTGRWESFGKQRHRYGVRGKKRWAIYGSGSGNINEIHPVQHFNFNKVLNTIGSEIASTNTNIHNQPSAEQVLLKNITTTSTSLTVEPNNITISTPNPVISGQVSAISPENLAKGTLPVIKTHLTPIHLPQESLYQINPDAPNGYLVETDRQFTDRKQWLSSDYMFTALRYDHNNVQKRLGDGFYEQRLVNEQIQQLTGRRFLDNYSSDFEQYKALMNNGIYYANKFNLTPGIGLTANQMAQLTSDMVWFVNQPVTLADGTTLDVLTPQVYLVSRNTEVTTEGALISAREIVADINGDIHNSGTIAGRDLTALSAQNITQQGNLFGNNVNLLAQQKLINLGGKIQALESATLVGKTGVNIASTTSSSANNDAFGNQFAHTHLDKQSDISVNGTLTIYSPQDVVLNAANVAANVIHIQGDNVELATINTSNKQHYQADADNYYRLDQQQEIGSQLNAQSDIQIVSKNNTTLRQAALHSDNGTIAIQAAQGNIHIQEGRNQEQLDFGAKSSQSGFLQKTTTVTKHLHQYDMAQGSTIDANNIVLQADKGNIRVQGSSVVAENQLVASANNIDIQHAENKIYQQDVEKTSKSGLMGSGGFGFSVGLRKDTTENDQTRYYASQSQVGSLTGNTTLLANNKYHQTASAVTAVEGDVNIQAKQVDILAASDKYDTNYKHTYEQKGLTIALTGAVVAALQAADSTLKSAKTAGDSDSGRINAMALANTGFDAMRTVEAVKEVGQAIQEGSATGGAVGVSITYGQQKSTQTQHTEGNTVTKSQVNAGGNVNIQASGAGQNSHLQIKGADIAGLQGTHLAATGDITIAAAQEKHMERSKNKSEGFNVGVAIQFGNGIAAGLTVGGNAARGYGNGDSQAWVASHIGDKNSLTTLTSGQDLKILGSQVKGQRVEVAAKNLNIESLQDTMKYEGKQESISGQVTVGYGFSAGGSYGRSKVNADYASVTTQAGIFAGEEGYHIDVGDHVKLTGGAILSQADSSKNSLSAKTLSFENIENYSNANASSTGFAGGFSIGRDQTSEKDKKNNDIYRAEREKNGETFKKANPNQTNSSPIKFGMGENDVHSADLYAISKIGLVNLLSNTKTAKNDSSTTFSVISDGQFNIKEKAGQANLDRIIKSIDSATNSLQQQDYQALQKEVDTASSIKRRFYTNISSLTDEAYRTMFIAEHRMMTVKTDENGEPIEDSKLKQEIIDEAKKEVNKKLLRKEITEDEIDNEIDKYYKKEFDKGRNIYQLREVSDQEREHLKQVTYTDPVTGKSETRTVIAFNGIFNDENAAAKFASQNYVAQTGESGNIDTKIYKDIYFVHHPQASNPISEFLIAGYEKMFETSFGNLLGMDNSSLQAMNLMETYGKDRLFIGSHSRGTLTVTNALNALSTKENQKKAILSDTRIKMVGPAADVTRADNTLSLLQTGSLRNESNKLDSIRIENHESDPVGSVPLLLGGNPATMTDNWKNRWLGKKLLDMFSDDSSVHNCHGLGQGQCIKDGYRKEGDLIMNKERTIFELNSNKGK